MNPTDQEKYDELSCYTLTHPDPSFIHQYIVDAYTAQHADENTKPIALTFALVGLYLCVERNFTGKQVQKAHMLLARRRKQWPSFDLPENRGAVTIDDVLHEPPGNKRDEAIRKWCDSVWEAYRMDWDRVVELVEKELG